MLQPSGWCFVALFFFLLVSHSGLQAVSPETMAILEEFDATEQGYTLLLPLNQDKFGEPLSDKYDINGTDFIDAADDIIKAHILPGTLDFLTLQEETNTTGMHTVTSLQVHIS